MTNLLKQAIAIIKDLPEDLQDAVARQIIQYVEGLSTFDEDAAPLRALSVANPQ
jgi:hypothetical protein